MGKVPPGIGTSSGAGPAAASAAVAGVAGGWSSPSRPGAQHPLIAGEATPLPDGVGHDGGRAERGRRVLDAFVLGAVAQSSLLLAGLAACRWTVPRRVVGLFSNR